MSDKPQNPFRYIVDYVTDGVLVSGEDGRVLFANAAAESMLGSEPLASAPLPPEIIIRRPGGEEGLAEVRFSTVEWDGQPARLAVLHDVSAKRQGRRALERSHAVLAASLDASTDGLLLVDETGKMVGFNRKFGEMWRLPEEILASRSDERAILFVVGQLADPDGFRAKIRQVNSDPGSDSFDLLHFKDGRVFERYSRPQRVAGDITGRLWTFRDVTMRLRAEEALKKSEAQLSNATRIASLGPWEYDVLADEFVFTDHFYNLLHTSAKREGGYRMKSREYAEKFVHPDDRALVGIEIAKALEAKDPGFSRSLEHRILYADGGVGHITVQFYIVKDALGRTVRTYGVNQDVTDRMRAEERIREQAALIDEASDAIIVFDLEKRVSFWSKGAERLYGWTAKEAVGILPMEALGADPREDAEGVLRSSEWKGEVSHVRKSGEVITVLSRKTLLRHDDGTPKSILCIDTDVTELKKIEAQLLRSQRLEGIGTLAGGIAHDLNNVFAPIIMGIPLLKEGVSGEDPLALLDEIEKSAKRGARMVKQVLVFARGVQGERRNVSPAHLLRELEQFASETFPKTYAFSFRASVDVWPVLGDLTQLHQVLLNLAVNARDAMPSGGRIIVSATNITLDENYAGMTAQAKPGPYVVLEVMDFGTGIPQALRERIFEPFFTTKPIGQGTGLGLATTLAIVKSHHGFIDLYSEERKGSTFKVYLPAQPEGDLSADPPIESLAKGNGEWVLVVDDEQAVRDTVTRTLLRHGYRALAAANGAEAVAIFAQKHETLSVVITDMIMPVMDGQAAIHAMKKIRPDIPIIAASGFAAGSEPGKARRAEGVVDFLQKPYTAAAMLRSLERILARK